MTLRPVFSFRVTSETLGFGSVKRACVPSDARAVSLSLSLSLSAGSGEVTL